MAVSSFAALFLAHGIADYLLQTKWLVTNKRRPIALGTHIALVFAAMLLTTLSFSPWFLALAFAHFCIDALKTYILPDGLISYIADQVLHVTSIVVIVGLAPGLWGDSPLADITWLPTVYLMVAGVLFAARGGQFAVLIFIGNKGVATASGGYLGWVERVALCLAAVAAGLWGALAVLALKGVSLVPQLRARGPDNRMRLVWGAGLSMAWGIVTAIGLVWSLQQIL